jgi:UDP-N-acetylmuramoyl-tripeptide--D-alanyl-D-alanine ligase
MLQSVEYETKPYLAWLRRLTDFRTVMQRRSLDKTRVATLFVWFLRIGIVLQMALGLWLLTTASVGELLPRLALAVVLVLSAPIVWAYAVLLPLVVARRFVIVPRQRRLVSETAKIFAVHKGIKIAVAGSYGKTTMKEILLTVLSEGKRVVATPANKNTATAHHAFAKSLAGDEDIIIVEFGEGKPGDVAQFTKTIQPDIGIITGLAPAHLDQYGAFENAARDIFTLADYLDGKPVYVNAESPDIEPYVREHFIGYDRLGAGKWKVNNVKVALEGTSFSLSNSAEKMSLHSGLLGEHLVGALSAAAAIASELGLTPKEIAAGIAKTAPYEHRMQPYRLAGGWVIDDAYNGNIEGIKAGTELLSQLSATRKIYVTPGLVDQGAETQRVHVLAGQLIAKAEPDIVVLMNNSVTEYIREGLSQAGFRGEVRVEERPLQFYTHLEHFLAAGDICMLQNDWTDNYV